MGRITGMEAAQDVPPKVLLLYDAVEQLIAEGADLSSVKVSTITELAGIGKGTAYDYFDSKDDIIACALLYQVKIMMEELSSALVARESFPEQITYLLDEIEKEQGKQQYFLRFIHVLTENSSYCQLVREKISSEAFREYLPGNVFEEIVQRGIDRGEIKAEFPAEYVVSAVFARLMSHLISICTEHCLHTNPRKYRSFIYKSILDELYVTVQP